MRKYPSGAQCGGAENLGPNNFCFTTSIWRASVCCCFVWLISWGAVRMETRWMHTAAANNFDFALLGINFLSYFSSLII